MKKNKIIAISVAVTVALIFVVTGIILRLNEDGSRDETAETATESFKTETTAPATETEAPPKPEFVSKKDFDALKEEYPHIYAWIEIPGTNIDYPVIQHPDDNEYYLRRDEAGNYSINGCIFSEHNYNSDDFSDPITLLYGHYVYEYDGFKYFGGLQSIYKDDLETCKDIIIYHPEKELHYEVFAAVPYNSYHILHGMDYSIAEQFNDFVGGVKGIKSYGANVNREYEVTPDDKLLVLSTCYNGNTDRRFLVVAKLVETFD